MAAQKKGMAPQKKGMAPQKKGMAQRHAKYPWGKHYWFNVSLIAEAPL